MYLGLLLEGRLLGLQVLSLYGQAELLHRRGWNKNSKCTKELCLNALRFCDVASSLRLCFYFINLQNTSECVPFEEGLTEPQEEEEQPKSLLEVSDAEEIYIC